MTDSEMFVVKKNDGCPKYHCTAVVTTAGGNHIGCTIAPVLGFYECEDCIGHSNLMRAFFAGLGDE